MNACSREGCGRKVKARGLCNTHYVEWNRARKKLPDYQPAPRYGFIDRTGERFGLLTVLGLSSRRGSKGQVFWRVRCDCGTEKEVRGPDMVGGHIVSCGCRSRLGPLEANTTHGMSNSPEHRIWIGMRSRCSNPRNTKWHIYGGRGITVCERWDSFEAFFKDMGQRPSSIHSIERIDGNGNYSPDNCAWASPTTQNRNTTRNRSLTYRGRTQTISAWAEEAGMAYGTLYRRLNTEGLDISEALNRPVR